MATTPQPLQWQLPADRHNRQASDIGQVTSYVETHHRYRIDHFLAYDELPFFALVIHGGRGHGRRSSSAGTPRSAKQRRLASNTVASDRATRRPGSPDYAVHMADRKRPNTPRPLTWRQPRGRDRSRSVAAALFFHDSTARYRIEQLIGYSELPFVAAVRDQRSPWRPLGRFSALDEAIAACQQHQQAPEANGTTRLNELGNPLPRRFWE